MPDFTQLLAPVYRPTTLGQSAVLGTGSRLRSDLLTILETIDGKRTTQTLVTRFAILGDVSAMLAELEDMYLIERPMDKTLPLIEQSSTSSSFPDTRNSSFPDTHYSEFPDTKAVFEETFAATLQADLHELPFHDTLGLEDSPGLALQRVRIRVVCDLMGSFIIAHLPANAFEELADLERISTTGHLMAYLSHFQELIGDLPQDLAVQVATHLADLDMRLEELLRVV